VITDLSHIIVVQWKSFVVSEDVQISWRANEAWVDARLAMGAWAEILLNEWQGMDGRTGILEDLTHKAAPRNTGFKMLPNKVETWKVGDQAFSLSGTTGFMITVDMGCKDLTF
jgi:hypothetical protein